MKNLCLLLLISLSVNCSHFKGTSNISLLSLKKAKSITDEYLRSHSDDLVVLVKSPEKNELVEVKNNNWPESIDYTLNILRNNGGKIILTALIPYSESGDQNIICKYYFDEQGKLYAFYKEESIFGEKDSVVRNILVKYYDDNFNMIYAKNWITDTHYKQIKLDSKQLDFPDIKYTIYKNLTEFIAAYNIH